MISKEKRSRASKFDAVFLDTKIMSISRTRTKYKFYRQFQKVGVARTRTKRRHYRQYQKICLRSSSNFKNGCEGRIKRLVKR